MTAENSGLPSKKNLSDSSVKCELDLDLVGEFEFCVDGVKLPQ